MVKNKKILILGSTGQSGNVPTLYLRERGFDVDAMSESNMLNDKSIILDLTNKEKFEAFLDSNKYDIIINCAGVLIEQSEKRKDLATYLNSFLPHFLEHRYQDTDTKIIHLSTDCVFSGQNAPYKEDSQYDGQLFYDRSKAVGEIINEKDLTFRMSLVGPDLSEDGVGLFNWFTKQRGEIVGYTGAMWSGITTIELARGIEAAIEQNLTGLYHLVPSKNISKYELLKLFKDVFRREDVVISPKDVKTADKTLINTRSDFDFEVSDYRTMLEEMKVWIDNHKDLYKHYNRKG